MYCVYKYVLDDEVIYVGQTQNLDQRIKTHNTEKIFVPLLPYCKIYYAEVLNLAEMTIFETILINNYQPRLNTHMKSKTARNISIDFPILEWIEYEKPYMKKMMSKLDWMAYQYYRSLSIEEQKEFMNEYNERFFKKSESSTKSLKKRRKKGEGSWGTATIKGSTYHRFMITIDGKRKTFYGHTKAEAEEKYMEYLKEKSREDEE